MSSSVGAGDALPRFSWTFGPDGHARLRPAPARAPPGTVVQTSVDAVFEPVARLAGGRVQPVGAAHEARLPGRGVGDPQFDRGRLRVGERRGVCRPARRRRPPTLAFGGSDDLLLRAVGDGLQRDAGAGAGPLLPPVGPRVDARAGDPVNRLGQLGNRRHALPFEQRDHLPVRADHVPSASGAASRMSTMTFGGSW